MNRTASNQLDGAITLPVGLELPVGVNYFTDTNARFDFYARAIALRIQPGNADDCLDCGEHIKFNARLRDAGRQMARVIMYETEPQVATAPDGERELSFLKSFGQTALHMTCYEATGRMFGDLHESGASTPEELRAQLTRFSVFSKSRQLYMLRSE